MPQKQDGTSLKEEGHNEDVAWMLYGW